MTLKQRITETLPHLSLEELWLLEKDCRRAADACAIGGGSLRKWNGYCEKERLFREARHGREGAPVPGRSFITPHTEAELKILANAWDKIQKGGRHGRD